MDEKGSKEDVYEFKSSKEATPVRGSSTSPDVDKNATEIKNEKLNEQEGQTISLGKRAAVDNETDELEDDAKRKKKKEEGTSKEGKPLTPAGRLAAVRSNNSASAKAQSHAHTPIKTVALATRAAVSSDRKSPSSPKGGGVSVASPTGSTKCDAESEGDGEKLGPKVPPLKIVIPQSGQEPEQGGVRNGKNNSSRHTALPYVVSSNSNDSEKDGSVSPTDPAIGMLSAEDQKGGQHQRVLRSSHRAGDQPTRPGSTGSSGAQGSPPAAPGSTAGTNRSVPLCYHLCIKSFYAIVNLKII